MEISFSHVRIIAEKEISEHKLRFLLVFICIPILSGLFFIPHIFVNTAFLEDLQIEARYLLYDPGIRRQLILVDLQLPIYVLIPAFATPFFGILESIIGEKDARTMEALFLLPVSRWTVLFGKIVPSVLFAIVLSWFSFVYHFTLFLIFTDKILALHLISWEWFIILILLIPGTVYMTSITAVYISMRVKKLQTAVNLSALILAPVFLLITAIGLGYIRIGTLFLTEGAVLILVIGIFMTMFVYRRFSVEKLILEMYD